MKKLIPLMFIAMLFTFALAHEGWQGNATNIAHESMVLKTTFRGKEFNTPIPPLTPMNTTLNLGNFMVSEDKAIENPKLVTITPIRTETPKMTGTTTTSQETKKETPTNETENLQRLMIDDKDIKVEIFLNKIYRPGDTIRADFYITNKQGMVNEIDIKLEVYYLGIKVFSYEHPSWREYREGKTIHIFQESKLPMVTLPGKYTLKFYITPVGRDTKEVSTSIVIKPNVKWLLFVITVMMLFLGAVLLIKRYWRPMVKTYKEFSIGQKFVFFAIVGLITAAVILAFGAENYANNIAILVYYLLLIGVLNEWVEYLRLRWDRKDVRPILSIYLLAFLVYLSKDTFTVYLSVLLSLTGTAVGVLKLRPSGKKSR